MGKGVTLTKEELLAFKDLLNNMTSNSMPKRPLLSISKTDYKVACSCAAKLYYRMNIYPSTKDEDEYMALLAEGGYMIGVS